MLKPNMYGTKSLNINALVTAAKKHEPIDSKDPKAYKALWELIESAEGRATARTLTPESAAAAIWRLERHLGVKRDLYEGMIFTLDIHADKFGSSYNSKAHGNRPQSTHISVGIVKGKWHVCDIFRAECTPVRCKISKEFSPDAINTLWREIGRAQFHAFWC